MKVLIDGRQVQVFNDVKVIYEDQFINEQDDEEGEESEEEGTLCVTANCEGVVFDAINRTGQIVKTVWMMPEHMLEMCH